MEAEKINAKYSDASTRWIVGGALLVTHFAAFANDGGLGDQIKRSLDATFRPASEDVTLTATDVTLAAGVSDASFSGYATALRIRGQEVWIVEPSGEQRPAPDGLYRLSDDHVIKVENGRLFVQVYDRVAQPPRWKLLCIKGSFGQACNKDEAGETQATVDVHEILASLGR